jgi:hypothetical protein
VLTGTTITGAGVATGTVNGAGVATGADCGDGVAAGAATGAAVASCDPERRLTYRDLRERIIAFVTSGSHSDNINACRHYRIMQQVAR